MSFSLLVELVASMVVILGAAVVFANAVEILGGRLQLATLGMFVLGSSALGFRSRRQSGDEISINSGVTRRDISYFLPTFFVAGAAGLAPLPLWAKVVLAVALTGTYVYYVRQTLRGGREEQEDSAGDLLLWAESRWGQAPTWAVLSQVVVMIGLMAASAHYFVDSVERLSGALGIPAGLVSLILAPFATELPETFNSIYWFRGSRDPIAVGNITGAMVFQSMVPVSLGLAFTTWSLNFRLTLAVALALGVGTRLRQRAVPDAGEPESYPGTLPAVRRVSVRGVRGGGDLHYPRLSTG